MNASLSASPLDWDSASAALERALEGADLLRPSQKQNVREKARDLFEGRSVWQSVPLRLMVELNRRCNTRCRMCPIEHSPTGGFELERLERLVDEIGWGVLELVPFVSGEPTLAPLAELAPLLRKHGIYFSLTTNGAELDADLLRSIESVTARINVSLQSHRREIQEHIVPGLSYERIVGNLRRAAESSAAFGFQLVCSCVVMDENVHHLEGYVRFIADLGVRRLLIQKLFPWGRVHEMQLLAAAISPEEREDRVCAAVVLATSLGVRVESNYGGRVPAPAGPVLESRFRALDEQSYLISLFRPGFCVLLATTAVLAADRSARPCCHQPIVLGDLGTMSFDAVWNGVEMQTLRREHFARELRPACAECTAFRTGSVLANARKTTAGSGRAAEAVA